MASLIGAAHRQMRLRAPAATGYLYAFLDLLNAAATPRIDVSPPDGSRPLALVVINCGITVGGFGSRRVVEAQLASLRALGYRAEAVVVHMPGHLSLRVPDVARSGLDLDGLWEARYASDPRRPLAMGALLRPGDGGMPPPLERLLRVSDRVAVPPLLEARLSARRPDVVIANYVWNLPFARRLSKGAPVIVETHDIQSLRDPEKTGLAQEIVALSSADMVIALNRDEAEIFARYLGREHVCLILPAMAGPPPASSCEETLSPDTPPTALFVGSRNRMNLRGLAWLVSEVWPLVRAAVPTARLVLAGDAVRAAQAEGILAQTAAQVDFAGRIQDLGDAYRRASAVAVPVQEGTGISIKTIEAMTYGKAVVSTSPGLRGFPADPAHPANDDAESFAGRLAVLLSDPVARGQAERLSQRIHAAAFAPAVHRAAWEAVLARLGCPRPQDAGALR
ncbi:MAG: glycosyltransferase family 4 protein [Pseudomonadota bacterium]